MAEAFALPKWGLTMEEGTITEWLVTEGDPVEKGQVIAIVETDKIEVEFECPADGTVESLLVPAGATVDVGTDVIVIG
jgi:pyruvate/2-oxoglutarate dehydrogenase complex dihydrolipoamide acyltransferase (E2) component